MKDILLAKYIVATALFIAILGCSRSGDTDALVSIVRLDKDISRYITMSVADRSCMVDSLQPYLSAYMQILGDDTISDSSLMSLSQSPAVQMFSPAVDSVFPQLDKCSEALASVDARVSENGLSIPSYRYATIVWGKEKYIVVNDSIMFIALNHYLGPEHEAYANWPEYQRVNKRPEMIVYDALEARLALGYPFQPAQSGATLLSQMVYDGALAYIKMQLIPDANEADAMGFTARQLNDIADNERFMWERLVSGKMLFSTDIGIASHLLNPAPASSLISPDAPGRAVRYIGYKIVCAYMENNPSTSLSMLLSPAFYNDKDLLRKSEYRK